MKQSWNYSPKNKHTNKTEFPHPWDNLPAITDPTRFLRQEIIGRPVLHEENKEQKKLPEAVVLFNPGKHDNAATTKTQTLPPFLLG